MTATATSVIHDDYLVGTELEDAGDLRNTLTLNDYQDISGDTAIYKGKGELTGLMYVGLGLGEAGEVQGKIKKLFRDLDVKSNDEIPLDKRDAIVDELGDLLWYVAQTATELNVALEDVALHNIQKLISRKERGVLTGSGDNR